MNKNPSPIADTTPPVSSEAPSTTLIQLDGSSSVPSKFRGSGTFTIIRLKSSVGLPEPITKLFPVRAMLVSISLKSLSASNYRLWAGDKLL
ncbi:MAG: hypothetical protein ACRDL7_09765, partial [Gaiellaceae bacterium]